MKIIREKIYEGRNIYSHKKCIRLDVDLEGYCETPSKDIENFNNGLVELLPELYSHRCGVDEEGGFVKRLHEGTYLAHICEHIIICLQNKVGIEVCYGKAREITGDFYYIIYQYEYERVGLECGRLAVEIINSLIKGEVIANFNQRVKLLEEIFEKEIVGPSTRAIIESAKKEEFPIIKLGDSGFYQIGYGKQGRVFEATIGSNTACVAADISCDKLLTKELLSIQNIPVAYGTKVYNIINLLKEGEAIGYPLVLKPQYGNKGNGVIVNIKNEKELVKAYNQIGKNYKDIILEEYVVGKDYRVCVVDYKVVAVALRVPPFIIGDGVKSIKSLIFELNNDPLRGKDHEKPLTKIKIDENLLNILEENGYNITSILEKDKKIYLRKNANISTGGLSIDCTDEICEENIDICIRAAKAIGLDVCGIDICTEDISIPLNNNGVIMEVNAAPGIRMHEYPSSGEKRNVGESIFNMLYKNGKKNIPIISVTGTNGKTTTTRLISHVLSLMGYTVGMTSTEGIFINGKCIDKGDDTGYYSAKAILLNKEVEIGVLETARGGLIRNGLAYDMSDVAVITNITEDHLGIDEVDTMEDLSKVKALVVEAVKKDGYAVINADDYWSRDIINRINANIIYFSKDKNNELIKKAIRQGEICVFTDDNYIKVISNKKEYRVVAIKDIPITLNGHLTFNIENALASCSALVGLGIDYCMIAKGLMSFALNDQHNPGRFNIYDVCGRKVILDYGHNIEGYKAVLKGLSKIECSSKIGVIGVPGDRSEEMTMKIGEICGEYLDRIIIKEDVDRRGKKVGEVAELLEYGVKNKNINYTIELDERIAFRDAFNNSDIGDLIIVFYEKRAPLIEEINNMINNDEGKVINNV
ncbi:MAG: cyanophycin synthetase [Clostridium sp.]